MDAKSTLTKSTNENPNLFSEKLGRSHFTCQIPSTDLAAMDIPPPPLSVSLAECGMLMIIGLSLRGSKLISARITNVPDSRFRGKIISEVEDKGTFQFHT